LKQHKDLLKEALEAHLSFASSFFYRAEDQEEVHRNASSSVRESYQRQKEKNLKRVEETKFLLGILEGL
jgi:hypothetical protein